MKFVFKAVLIVCIVFSCSFTSKPEKKLKSYKKIIDKILVNESNRLAKIAKKSKCDINQWKEIKQLLIKSKSPQIKCISWYAVTSGEYYTTAKDKAKYSLVDREYFGLLLKKQKIYGWPVISKSENKKAIVTAVPVIIDGKVCGIIGSSIFLKDFWNYIDKIIKLPKNYDFYALDEDGTAVFDLESKDLIFDNPLLQASASLRKATKKIITTSNGIVLYKWADKNKIAYYEKSTVARWRYVVSVY